MPRCRFVPLLATALCAACAASLPANPVQRALYVDLTKAVELSDDTGWVVDRVQIEGNAEDALRSTCQVAPADRAALDQWLSARLEKFGGSAARVYHQHGKDLDAAKATLELERVRALLRYATEHAAQDCPFWLEPRADFRGVQSDEGRLVVLAETLGYGTLVFEGDDAAIGGGGGGRLLFGHGFGPQLTLAVGGEVGGAGAFVPNAQGTRSIATTFSAAVPVVVRLARFSRVFDIEIAPTLRFNPDADILPPGVRVSVALGFTTMRSAAFMPYALLWSGYEYHPPDNRGAADHNLSIGTRVGVDWDP